MSPQMMGKSSRPDKKGIGEQWEENLRIKERGMGGNWDFESRPRFRPAVVDAVRDHNLTNSP